MEQRTDLAMEARELWQRSAGATSRLSGVRAREQQGKGIRTTLVEILNEEGAGALHKPVGTYLTLELDWQLLQTPSGFGRAAVRLGRDLGRLLPGGGPVLVAGLGNAAVTPDSLGPRALRHLVVTRQLGERYPQLRPVSAVAPGVLGTTGVESSEVIRGTVERTRPVCVVAVDALASCEPGRLFTTIQLSDTGIIPGSGVGNHRSALTEETLGVPVVAVGIPTVVEADSLFCLKNNKSQPTRNDKQHSMPQNLILTSRDVDAKVGKMAKLVGCGLSLGLQKCLSLEDISILTEA